MLVKAIVVGRYEELMKDIRTRSHKRQRYDYNSVLRSPAVDFTLSLDISALKNAESLRLESVVKIGNYF